MPRDPDYYETDSGKLVGNTLAEAAAWAKANPAEYALTHVWWMRSDDAEAIIIDSDINDILATEADADTVVLTPASVMGAVSERAVA